MVVILLERALPKIQSTTSTTSSSSTSTSAITSSSSDKIDSSLSSGITSTTTFTSNTVSSPTSTSSTIYPTPTPPTADGNPFIFRKSNAPQGTVYIAVGSLLLAVFMFTLVRRVWRWWRDRRMCSTAGDFSNGSFEKLPHQVSQPPITRDLEKNIHLTPQYSDNMAYKGTYYSYSHSPSSSTDSGSSNHSRSHSSLQLFISPTVEIGKHTQGKQGSQSPSLVAPLPRKPPSIARPIRGRKAIPSVYLDSLLELSEAD